MSIVGQWFFKRRGLALWVDGSRAPADLQRHYQLRVLHWVDCVAAGDRQLATQGWLWLDLQSACPHCQRLWRFVVLPHEDSSSPEAEGQVLGVERVQECAVHPHCAVVLGKPLTPSQFANNRDLDVRFLRVPDLHWHIWKRFSAGLLRALPLVRPTPPCSSLTI